MKIRKTNENGFTLIEVIVTLVLVGITATLAGMWIVSVANGYVFTKTNASTVQKAQLAMTRLSKEFSAISAVTATTPTPTSITYTRTNETLGVDTVTVSLNGNDLEITVNGVGPNILTDSVSGFTLRYCSNSQLNQTTCSRTAWAPPPSGEEPSKIIEISLTLKAGSNTPVPFVQRVIPRNL
jgi:prepilin-type N-terminal cleavage/methylation domain-containing protein